MIIEKQEYQILRISARELTLDDLRSFLVAAEEHGIPGNSVITDGDRPVQGINVQRSTQITLPKYKEGGPV